MSDKSAIEWTDATWNPVRGCSKVSPGCAHCYAETFAERFRGVEGHPYEQGFDLRLVPDKLQDPLRWTKPRMIFVNSMSDLFHPKVPFEYIDRVFTIMSLARRHTFQVLTKRAERMLEWSKRGCINGEAMSGDEPLPNVWLGVSVENRKHGLPRIEHLRRTPAAVRMLSVEPLLEDLGRIDLTGIHWVIVGGESGVGARPMHPAWVRRIRDQCVKAGVPFFFKQWGGWFPLDQDTEGQHAKWFDSDKAELCRLTRSGIRGNDVSIPLTEPDYPGVVMGRVGKKAAGRLLDGELHDAYPAAKAVPA